MTSLPLHALVQVVEHLPTPLVVTDEAGYVVGASAPAVELLGPDFDASAIGRVRLRDHLGGMAFPPRTTTPTSLVSDGAPHELVGLSDRFDRTEVPADVAALAGEVAHDFNNLLGVIINFASLAASELPTGSAGERDLREVITASKRGAAITQRLLDVNQASGHEPHPERAGIGSERFADRGHTRSA